MELADKLKAKEQQGKNSDQQAIANSKSLKQVASSSSNINNSIPIKQQSQRHSNNKHKQQIDSLKPLDAIANVLNQHRKQLDVAKSKQLIADQQEPQQTTTTTPTTTKTKKPSLDSRLLQHLPPTSASDCGEKKLRNGAKQANRSLLDSLAPKPTSDDISRVGASRVKALESHICMQQQQQQQPTTTTTTQPKPSQSAKAFKRPTIGVGVSQVDQANSYLYAYNDFITPTGELRLQQQQQQAFGGKLANDASSNPNSNPNSKRATKLLRKSGVGSVEIGQPQVCLICGKTVSARPRQQPQHLQQQQQQQLHSHQTHRSQAAAAAELHQEQPNDGQLDLLCVNGQRHLFRQHHQQQEVASRRNIELQHQDYQDQELDDDQDQDDELIVRADCDDLEDEDASSYILLDDQLATDDRLKLSGQHLVLLLQQQQQQQQHQHPNEPNHRSNLPDNHLRQYLQIEESFNSFKAQQRHLRAAHLPTSGYITNQQQQQQHIELLLAEQQQQQQQQQLHQAQQHLQNDSSGSSASIANVDQLQQHFYLRPSLTNLHISHQNHNHNQQAPATASNSSNSSSSFGQVHQQQQQHLNHHQLLIGADGSRSSLLTTGSKPSAWSLAARLYSQLSQVRGVQNMYTTNAQQQSGAGQGLGPAHQRQAHLQHHAHHLLNPTQQQQQLGQTGAYYVGGEHHHLQAGVGGVGRQQQHYQISSDSSLGSSGAFASSALRATGGWFRGLCSRKCLLVSCLLTILFIFMVVISLSAYLNYLISSSKSNLQPMSGRLRVMRAPAAMLSMDATATGAANSHNNSSMIAQTMMQQLTSNNKTSQEFLIKQQQFETILRGALDKTQLALKSFPNHLVKLEVYNFKQQQQQHNDNNQLANSDANRLNANLWVYFRLFVNKRTLTQDAQLMRRKSPDEQLDRQFLPRLTQQTLLAGFEQLISAFSSSSSAAAASTAVGGGTSAARHAPTPSTRTSRAASTQQQQQAQVRSFDEQISRLMHLVDAIDLQSVQVTPEFDMLQAPTVASNNNNNNLQSAAPDSIVGADNLRASQPLTTPPTIATSATTTTTASVASDRDTPSRQPEVGARPRPASEKEQQQQSGAATTRKFTLQQGYKENATRPTPTVTTTPGNKLAKESPFLINQLQRKPVIVVATTATVTTAAAATSSSSSTTPRPSSTATPPGTGSSTTMRELASQQQPRTSATSPRPVVQLISGQPVVSQLPGAAANQSLGGGGGAAAKLQFAPLPRSSVAPTSGESTDASANQNRSITPKTTTTTTSTTTGSSSIEQLWTDALAGNVNGKTLKNTTISQAGRQQLNQSQVGRGHAPSGSGPEAAKPAKVSPHLKHAGSLISTSAGSGPEPSPSPNRAQPAAGSAVVLSRDLAPNRDGNVTNASVNDNNGSIGANEATGPKIAGFGQTSSSNAGANRRPSHGQRLNQTAIENNGQQMKRVKASNTSKSQKVQKKANQGQNSTTTIAPTSLAKSNNNQPIRIVDNFLASIGANNVTDRDQQQQQQQKFQRLQTAAADKPLQRQRQSSAAAAATQATTTIELTRSTTPIPSAKLAPNENVNINNNDSPTFDLVVPVIAITTTTTETPGPDAEQSAHRAQLQLQHQAPRPILHEFVVSDQQARPGTSSFSGQWRPLAGGSNSSSSSSTTDFRPTLGDTPSDFWTRAGANRTLHVAAAAGHGLGSQRRPSSQSSGGSQSPFAMPMPLNTGNVALPPATTTTTTSTITTPTGELARHRNNHQAQLQRGQIGVNRFPASSGPIQSSRHALHRFPGGAPLNDFESHRMSRMRQQQQHHQQQLPVLAPAEASTQLSSSSSSQQQHSSSFSSSTTTSSSLNLVDSTSGAGGASSRIVDDFMITTDKTDAAAADPKARLSTQMPPPSSSGDHDAATPNQHFRHHAHHSHHEHQHHKQHHRQQFGPISALPSDQSGHHHHRQQQQHQHHHHHNNNNLIDPSLLHQQPPLVDETVPLAHPAPDALQPRRTRGPFAFETLRNDDVDVTSAASATTPTINADRAPATNVDNDDNDHDFEFDLGAGGSTQGATMNSDEQPLDDTGAGRAERSPAAATNWRASDTSGRSQVAAAAADSTIGLGDADLQQVRDNNKTAADIASVFIDRLTETTSADDDAATGSDTTTNINDDEDHNDENTRFGHRTKITKRLISSAAPSEREQLPVSQIAKPCKYHGCVSLDRASGFVCLNSSQICDDSIDCQDESDELDCVSLMKSEGRRLQDGENDDNTNTAKRRLNFSNGAGIVYLKRRGLLAPLCVDYQNGTSGAEQAKRQELIRQVTTIGQYACSLQSFGKLVSVKINHHDLVDGLNLIKTAPLFHRLSIVHSTPGAGERLASRQGESDEPPSSSSSADQIYKSAHLPANYAVEVSTSAECPTRQSVFVKCGSFECGRGLFGETGGGDVKLGQMAPGTTGVNGYQAHTVRKLHNQHQHQHQPIAADFPWLVKLYYLNSLACHGYLIDESWLISSAECFASQGGGGGKIIDTTSSSDTQTHANTDANNNSQTRQQQQQQLNSNNKYQNHGHLLHDATGWTAEISHEHYGNDDDDDNYRSVESNRRRVKGILRQHDLSNLNNFNSTAQASDGPEIALFAPGSSIVLAKLDKPVRFSPLNRPVCLPDLPARILNKIGKQTTGAEQLPVELDKIYKNCVTASLRQASSHSTATTATATTPIERLNARMSPTQQQQQQQQQLDLILNKAKLSRLEDCLISTADREPIESGQSLNSNNNGRDNLVCANEQITMTHHQQQQQAASQHFEYPSTRDTGARNSNRIADIAKEEATSDVDDATTRSARAFLICSTGNQGSQVMRSKWTVVGVEARLPSAGSRLVASNRRLFTTVSSQIEWIVDTMSATITTSDRLPTTITDQATDLLADTKTTTTTTPTITTTTLVNSVNFFGDELSRLGEPAQNDTTSICNRFKCSSGECLSWSRICDGLYDCSSHDDERDCHK